MKSDGRGWRRYLRFWGANVDADIDDELRFHLEARVRDYIAAGHAEDDARRLATERFGSERDVRGALRRHDMRKLQQRRRTETVDELWQDVRYGARKLAHAPGFTAAVIAVLALGIGANTAIYSAVDAAFFRPLPFRAPARLVAIPDVQVPINLGGPSRAKSYADATDLAKLDVFESFAVHALGGLNLEGGAEPLRASVAHVTLGFFKTLGRFPSLGRTFTIEEETPGGPRAAVLSNHVWAAQFGGERSVLGRAITLNKVSYTIVGVMPADFAFPGGADLWVPLPMPAGWDVFEAFTGFMSSRGIARLAPNVTPRLAAERVKALEKRYSARTVVNDSTIARAVVPLQSSMLPAQSHDALLLLMASAALVLLIACANVANLLLSRAFGRRREVAIRTVLGATRLRVLRQLVVESVLLSLAGGVAGLIVGRVGVVALAGLMPNDLVSVAPPRLDPRVLAFTLAVAVGTGFLFGLWPSFAATRTDAGEVIKAGGAFGSTERDRGALRATLVVVEVALALVLLVGAGLLLESFRALMATDAGFQTKHVITARLVLPTAKYKSRVSKATFFDQVAAQLRSGSGVESASIVNVLPLARQNMIGLIIRDAEGGRVDRDDPMHPEYLQVASGYFSTMGISLLRGRDFSSADDSTTQSAIINKTMAETLWPGEDPLGRHFGYGGNTRRVVVGVVADVLTQRLDESPEPQMYFPIQDVTPNDVTIIVRGTLPTSALATRVRDAVRLVDPSQAVYAIRPMSDVVATSVRARRTNTVLLATFGLVAVVLAAVGVYAVLAYGVAQRTREIGVRVALGALRADVLRLVVGRGIVLSLLGVVCGVGGAYAATRFMASLLYHVSAHDVRVFVAAPLLLLVIALLATFVPAWRATRVDPLVALREQT